jgi:kinesin family protein 11
MSSLVDRTAHFLSEEIADDLPTGVTPRKKVWSVPTTWERTEPREALIAAMHRRAANGDLPTGPSEDAPADGQEDSGTVMAKGRGSPRSTSTNSLSDAENQMASANSIPSLPSITGLSHLKQPSKRLDASVKGRKGVEEVSEKMPLTVLGEGGANIPRRTRR